MRWDRCGVLRVTCGGGGVAADGGGRRADPSGIGLRIPRGEVAEDGGGKVAVARPGGIERQDSTGQVAGNWWRAKKRRKKAWVEVLRINPSFARISKK